MKDVLYFSRWKKNKVVAGVTTRQFPLHLKKTDDLGLPATQTKFKRALFESRFAYLHQVHGGRVAVLARGEERLQGSFCRIGEADGAITNISGLTILAMTADCLSIFFRAPGWVGVVHAGWRGSQEKIAKTAVERILQKSQCKPSQMHAIFGPSICGRHYEVGEEFKKYFGKPALSSKSGKYHLDLVLENVKQVRSAGVPLKNIFRSDLCTVQDKKRFYSFRREKEFAGRMVSFIRLEP